MSPKKDIIYITIIAILVALCGQCYYSYRYVPQHQHQIDVYYNHQEKLNDQVIGVVRDADKFVYFAIYTFTRTDIKDAILAAKHRGLIVIGITDKNQYDALAPQKKIIDELRDAGIPVYEQSHSGIMHMKTVVTEKSYASGSYNWTASATTLNDEVLEVGRDDAIRKKYEDILLELFRRYGNTNR